MQILSLIVALMFKFIFWFLKRLSLPVYFFSLDRIWRRCDNMILLFHKFYERYKARNTIYCKTFPSDVESLRPAFETVQILPGVIWGESYLESFIISVKGITKLFYSRWRNYSCRTWLCFVTTTVRTGERFFRCLYGRYVVLSLDPFLPI